VGRLDGKVAIVTGGGGPGIGQGISRVLAREGAHVVILEIDLAAAEKVQYELKAEGGRASVIYADVRQPAEVSSAIDRTVRECERLDVLVNSAGVGLVKAVADASEAEFDGLVSIDLRGIWLCCKYAIPWMQRQRNGAIVNIASVHSRATVPNFGIYAALKSGVVGLTRGIAVQYGPEGIRANAVCPGLVDSPQGRQIIAGYSSNVEGWLSAFVRRHQALPRPIEPQDVGRLVAFLASAEAGAITGAEIPIDAGLWAKLYSAD